MLLQTPEVERLYLGCLETAVGDALAELQPVLPMLEKIDSMHCRSLMGSIDDLSTQILRSRLDKGSSIRSVRRLLAALMPLDEAQGSSSSGDDCSLFRGCLSRVQHQCMRMNT